MAVVSQQKMASCKNGTKFYTFLANLLIRKLLKFNNLSKRVIFLSLFTVLVFNRFSYWKDSGLGDNANIPLNSRYIISVLDNDTAGLYDKEVYGESKIGKIKKCILQIKCYTYNVIQTI